MEIRYNSPSSRARVCGKYRPPPSLDEYCAPTKRFFLEILTDTLAVLKNLQQENISFQITSKSATCPVRFSQLSAFFFWLFELFFPAQVNVFRHQPDKYCGLYVSRENAHSGQKWEPPPLLPDSNNILFTPAKCKSPKKVPVDGAWVPLWGVESPLLSRLIWSMLATHQAPWQQVKPIQIFTDKKKYFAYNQPTSCNNVFKLERPYNIASVNKPQVLNEKRQKI